MRSTTFATTILAALIALGAVPAHAGTAENAFLAKLVGNWTGSGQLSGADNGALACKLTFKPKGAAVAFSGKCDAKGLGSQAFSGNLSYNDAAKQYEAGSADQTAVGVKSGSGVTFSTKMRSIAGAGTSVMKVSTKSIVIDFVIARGTGGKTSKSHLVFSK